MHRDSAHPSPRSRSITASVVSAIGALAFGTLEEVVRAVLVIASVLVVLTGVVWLCMMIYLAWDAVWWGGVLAAFGIAGFVLTATR